jgi:hypothetical protein
MILTCYCGNGLDIPYTKKKQVLPDLTKFCGVDCITQYLKTKEVEKVSNGIKPNNISQALEYWDNRFQMFFRSRTESVVANFSTNSKIVWLYEPYTIVLKNGREYTPDFYLPEFGHFLEVKGLWQGSAKKKIRLAIEQGYSVVLIPDYLARKMEKWNDTRYGVLPSEESPFP